MDEDHAFVRDGDWKLFGSKLSLAAAHLDKTAALSADREAWTKRVNVYPIPAEPSP